MVDATPKHAARIAVTMRVEEIRELQAASGMAPDDAVIFAIAVSQYTRTILVDGEPAALFGVAPLPSEEKEGGPVGSVWLLASNLVDEVPIEFTKVCLKELSRMREDWAVLINFIDARYEKALRWAYWMGFEVRAPIPYGRAQLPFHPIRIERTKCVDPQA